MSLDLAVVGAEAVKAAPWAGLVTLMGMWVRSRVPMRKMRDESDKSLRADLLKQIENQELAHAAEIKALQDRQIKSEERAENQRIVYEERFESQRLMYEAKLEYERVTHAGESASFRHKVSNLEQALNMLLVLIETSPERAGDAAKRVRELREKQENQEQAEKTAIVAAKITASAPSP